jgi:OOP family OmpA-OmpF porin
MLSLILPENQTMKSRHIVLGAIVGLCLPVAAQAQLQGFYVGGAGGVDFPVDAKAPTSGGENKVKYDAGPTGSLSLGYKFGAFRAELEGNYRTNDVNKTSGAALSSPHGHTRMWGAMLNGFYDINTGTAFTPYLGAGVGVGFVHASLNGVRPIGSTLGGYSGSDTVFAYQGIAGASYALSPHLSLTADYRYVATDDARIKSGGAKWNVENANHVVTAGLRWTFGAPATANALVAPEPQRGTEFTVFFNWDKSDITAEAHDVIAKAAATAAASAVGKPTVALVTGYTDTSGSPAYNQKLSERRAASVKRELIGQGIPADAIQTYGKGESNLLVPTGDNVRELQNRRATIVLRIG